MKLMCVKDCRGWRYCHNKQNPNCNLHNCDNVRCSCAPEYNDIKIIEIKGVEL